MLTYNHITMTTNKHAMGILNMGQLHAEEPVMMLAEGQLAGSGLSMDIEDYSDNTLHGMFIVTSTLLAVRGHLNRKQDA